MTASLFVLDQQKLIDKNGVSPGALVYFYITGTSTLTPVYTSNTLITPLSNPVVADANGQLPEIWLNTAVTYRRKIVYADGTTNDVDPYVNVATGLAPLVADNVWTGTQTITADVDLSGAFVGNGNRAAKFGINETFTTVQGSQGNIGHCITLYNNHGPTGADDYGVALGVFAISSASATDTWAINAGHYTSPGTSASTNHFTAELDMNVENADYGNSPFVFGTVDGAFIASPLALVGVSGTGLYKGTAAIIGQRAGTGGPCWNRGVAFSGDCIANATFQDATNSTNVLLVSGAHTIGLDLQRATGMTHSLISPNNCYVAYRKTDTTLVKSYVGTDDLYHFADGCAGTKAHCSLLPSADNSFTLGGSGARWSVVWAATGTINTSDPDTKTDAKPLPEMLGIVKAIQPYSAKYKVGGLVAEVGETLEWVQDTKTVESVVNKIEMRDGKAVEVQEVIVTEEPQFDYIPVVDENGKPVMVTTEAKPAIVDPKTGKILVPARKEVTEQKIHREPRMVKKSVPTTNYVERAGVRDHFVFMADEDLKKVFDQTGLDFAGYIQGEDGIRGLRYDQFIPVLWKAVQELAAKVEELSK